MVTGTGTYMHMKQAGYKNLNSTILGIGIIGSTFTPVLSTIPSSYLLFFGKTLEAVFHRIFLPFPFRLESKLPPQKK